MSFINMKQNFRPSKLTKYFLMLSGTILLVGIIMFAILGFNLGMDFTGGNVIEVQVGETLEDDGVYTTLSQKINNIFSKIDGNLKVSAMQIKDEGADACIEIQYQNINGYSDEKMSTVNDNLKDALIEELGYDVSPTETKGATSTTETLTYALMAIFLALIAMLIYIAIRFKLLSGIATIVVLLHDVLLMCAFVVICRIEVNASFIAAVITILGYSVNNTIIIFDRVRENSKKSTLSNLTPKEIADLSVRQTFQRTINTSVTTILAILMLAIFGVASMREFVLPILFGLIVGTYAAIFISAPIWSYLMSRSGNSYKEKKNSQNDTNVVDTTAVLVEE